MPEALPRHSNESGVEHPTNSTITPEEIAQLLANRDNPNVEEIIIEGGVPAMVDNQPSATEDIKVEEIPFDDQIIIGDVGEVSEEGTRVVPAEDLVKLREREQAAREKASSTPLGLVPKGVEGRELFNRNPKAVDDNNSLNNPLYWGGPSKENEQNNDRAA